jgi:hypothetical protein
MNFAHEAENLRLIHEEIEDCPCWDEALRNFDSQTLLFEDERERGTER